MSSIRQFRSQTKHIKKDQIIKVGIDRIPGDGRGDIFFNMEESFKDDYFNTGVMIIGWDGYDDDDDFDDFGSQFYTCTIRGTKSQCIDFIRELSSRGVLDYEMIED